MAARYLTHITGLWISTQKLNVFPEQDNEEKKPIWRFTESVYGYALIHVYISRHGTDLELSPEYGPVLICTYTFHTAYGLMMI